MDADEAALMMIDALEKNYKTEKINERMEALRKFKEEVSVFSLNTPSLNWISIYG